MKSKILLFTLFACLPLAYTRTTHTFTIRNGRIIYASNHSSWVKKIFASCMVAYISVRLGEIFAQSARGTHGITRDAADTCQTCLEACHKGLGLFNINTSPHTHPVSGILGKDEHAIADCVALLFSAWCTWEILENGTY